ncbi:HupE/UreJ family protein [Roseibium sp. RKSG952]|uniref:HupE/UreJ family protein n=1 Tax=Roseibium sp. RKSG952 TaxID=2529384 RepID=UPI0012BC49E9|nr:HupE/UreJ family protein [Roseibium sp. RKSG952]MTH95709.1 HupE/UreJ family protein [Roseibium sp. RKSG952]
MRGLWHLVALLVLLAGVPLKTAHGHALEPGFGSLEQIGGDTWHVFWRQPDVAGRAMPIRLQLPGNCTPRTGPDPRAAGGAWESTWVATCPDGLAGKRLDVLGLQNTRTDALLHVAPLGAPPQSLRVTALDPATVVPAQPDSWSVLKTYSVLGFDHILEGWDHLLFLFALILLIRDFWRLIGAVTAFTVAHSLTLAATTFGWVSLPSGPVEAIIALSIVFLASELALARPGTLRLSQSAPWLVTFAFGLLHGMGFAGALREIGLPQSDVPLALLAFNLGVEAGQIAFIVVIAAVFALVSKALRHRDILSARPAVLPLAYVIGGWSSFWFIERVGSFFA